LKAYIKRIFTSIVLFSCIESALHGQAVDSLKSKLNEDLPDSLKIVTLMALSNEYQFIDIQKSFEYANEAIRIGETNDWKWAKALTYKNVAKFHGVQGDYNSAINFTKLALNLNFELKDSIQMAKCYNNLGTYSMALGRFDEGYFYHSQSYRIASSAKLKLQEAISLHNIAGVFKELGQYDRAFDYLKLSSKISKEIGDAEGVPYNFEEMGDIYTRKGQYDSALTSLVKSLRFARNTKLRINDLEGRVIAKIAKVYVHKNETKKAFTYYDTAFNIYTKNRNGFGQAEVEFGRGTAYIQEKKYAEAQKLIEQSAVKAHDLRAWSLEIQCYEKLSTLHEQKGEYQKALQFYKQHQQLEDSLFSQGMQTRLLQDQIQFETEAKEEQIRSLTNLEVLRKGEIKKQELIRNILVVVMALTGILLFAVYRSGQRRIRINKLLLQHQDDIKKRSVELEQLNQVKDKFFSIISHDLRSPMNALSGVLDLMNKDQITQDEFKTLSKELQVRFNHTKGLINNLLDWALLQMDKFKIQVEKIDLKELVETNVALLTSLHLKTLDIKNMLAPTIFALGDRNMINLVVRNLVMNAIKFSETGDEIVIAAQDTGDFYTISIKDNGVGISPEIQKILFEKTSGYSTRGTANEKGTGLGLILSKEFVERNGGKIWLESEMGKGSTFYFTVKKG
jgi:signal transduction histidine kinase